PLLSSHFPIHGTPTNREEKLMSSRRFGTAVSLIVLFLFTTVAFAEEAKTTTTTAPTAAQRYGTWGVDLEGMDRSVKPGNDFFKFVNGKGVADTHIRADKTRSG